MAVDENRRDYVRRALILVEPLGSLEGGPAEVVPAGPFRGHVVDLLEDA